MLNELTRHQIYLDRYASRINNDLQPILEQSLNNLIARLYDKSTMSQTRIMLLVREIKALIKDSIDIDFKDNLFINMQELAEYENRFTLGLIGSNSTAVIGAGFAPEVLEKTILNAKTAMANKTAKNFNQLVATFSKAYQKDIGGVIQRGLVEGLSTQEMVKQIKDTYKGRTRNQAEALVRTTTNHVASITRSDTFREYDYLYKGERYVATLDSSTTVLCASLDGKIFDFGKGQMTPAHWNCRSVRVPELKDEYKIIKDTTRASKGGAVSSRLTYSGWLRQQTKEVQNEVLGEQRAKLFRSGKLTLDKFVDKTGSLYTLKDLERADGIK